ncbi:MAG: DMT family transporter [Ignavibacteria bacterium]|nr:DMT family transporter [Ignavibacteria bacterium]
MQDEQKSLLFGIIAILFWSTVATAFKIALQKVTPELLVAYSSFFSFSILLVNLITFNKFKLVRAITLKQVYISALAGFLNPFLYYSILFKAYSLLPAQEALSLNYTWAIVLTVLTAIYQRKRIPLLSYFALFISFFGVLIILSKGSIVSLKPSNPYGAIFALSSALVWGLSWLINLSSKTDDNLRLLLNFSFGTLYCFIYLALKTEFELLVGLEILPVVYIGFFEMGITFLVWNKALKFAKNPAKINNLIYLSPFISILFISLILKESIHYSTIIGLLVIILGVVLQSTKFTRAS